MPIILFIQFTGGSYNFRCVAAGRLYIHGAHFPWGIVKNCRADLIPHGGKVEIFRYAYDGTLGFKHAKALADRVFKA